jgi:hypothetical protein
MKSEKEIKDHLKTLRTVPFFSEERKREAISILEWVLDEK